MSALNQETRLPPTGVVTFLFTDIEGSTRNWERHPDQMRTALGRHNALLRTAIADNDGLVFETAGDSFVAIFERPLDAVQAAVDAQSTLLEAEWPEPIGPLKVRMAVHTGPAEQQADGYYAQHTLSRLSRILATCHGGQILLSAVTEALVRDALPEAVELVALGEHRLRDLIAPQQVFQLNAPGLVDSFPPLRSLDIRPNNLPVQLTALIGREKEVDAVVTLLSRPEARDTHILTLTGPGGTGKTRVGLQAAAELIDRFDHGVSFVNLAPVTDAELVAPAMALALGVKEVAGEPIIDTLKTNLRDKRMLLLVDNFEQVTAAAPQVGELASAAPGVKVLVTSRVPLRITGENEYPVPPLALPDTARLPAPAELTRCEAVRLFLERATAIKPGFRLTAENSAAIAEICVRLDGLPLAIELAAARIRLLTPQAMLARLQNRLKLLTSGARDASDRQRTLRGAINWSYELLSPPERQLFRRLAVFTGVRTLEAIEAVCADGLEIDVLDGVESLVENNLVNHHESADGEPRFTMLETIYEFAREMLTGSGELAELQRRHAEYYAEFARNARLEPSGKPGEGDDLELLELEHDNFRGALEWAVADIERAALAAGLAQSLRRFWYVRGHWAEGAEWLAKALTVTAGQDIPIRAELLYGAGVMAVERGDHLAARRFLEQSLQAYREQGDERWVAVALTKLGDAFYAGGDYDTARRLIQEALEQSRRLGDLSHAGRVLTNLGEVFRAQGEHAAARKLYEEAIAAGVADQTGSTADIVVHSNLGFVVHRQGELQLAMTLFRDVLTKAERLGYQQSIALSFVGLAGVAASFGTANRAARLIGAADRLLDEIGAKLWPADRLAYDHNVAAVRAELDEAEFRRQHDLGRAMTTAEAADYALNR